MLEALAHSGAERGYPPSIGTRGLPGGARRRGWPAASASTVDPAHVAACVGTKELVAGMPQWLRLRRPDRDTVLYPAISYPTYAMGATLAGCRAVPVRADLDGDRPGTTPRRALCLWVNCPGNPTGDARRPRRGGRRGAEPHGVPVLSDECYVEFTWDGPPRTILEHGARRRGGGALAVEALQPGRRAGRLLRR